MQVKAPEYITVIVVDYEVTLVSGKEVQYTLRTDLGDTEELSADGLRLVMAQGKHLVSIDGTQIAIISRRERPFMVQKPVNV